MTSQYVIGIDYGTDSCRVLVVDASNGREVATSVSRYKRWSKGLYCDPATNRYRQHPQDYIDSMIDAITEAVSQLDDGQREGIVGLCFDTTGSTPALTDKTGTPLALLPRYAENPDAMFILWKDHTAVVEADLINDLTRESDIDYTAFEGGIYSSEWVWAKVTHVMRTNPAMAEAAWSWVEHCDWMAGLVTGNTCPETILRSRCTAGQKALWHESWGGLPPKEFLAQLHPALGPMRDRLYTKSCTSDTKAGTVTPEWAARLGLPAGVAVAVGALDAHMGAVGAGAGMGVLTQILGTSGCNIIIADAATLGERCIPGICGQVDGSVIPGYTGMEASQAAFGDIYAWFKELIAWPLRCLMPENADREKALNAILPALMEQAAKLSPGQSGIVALDWMNGRRTPFVDDHVRGAITGLTLGSTAPMLFRALIEATAFGSRAIIDHLSAEGLKIESVHATGGISHKSPLVMQILSDVFGIPIRVVRSEQACALGAAMFAAVVAGLYPNVEVAQKAMSSGFSAEYKPDPVHHKIYNELYKKYLALRMVG